MPINDLAPSNLPRCNALLASFLTASYCCIAFSVSALDDSALRTALEKDGLIRLQRIRTGLRGGQITLTELTDRAYGLLASYKVAAKRPAGRGGFEHGFWQHTAHAWAERKGYGTKIEEEVSGKAVDVGVTTDSQRIAVEVMMEGLDKELTNVAKDLEAGWDRVWLCAVKEEALERLRAKILDVFGSELLENGRVRFLRLSEFLEKGKGSSELNAQGPGSEMK